MKQLETGNNNLIASTLSFYEEIGIDIFVSKPKFNKNIGLSINNKQIDILNKDSSNTENKEKQINELEYFFKNIDDFILKKTSSNFVKFAGNINSKILIIDGTPDIDEDKTGIPFVSQKGTLFDNMLNAIEIKRDDVFLIKSIPWRPPGNRFPTEEELKICRPFIFNLIKLMIPKIIVCLGEVPTNQILELDESILKVRGKWRLLKSETIFKNDVLKSEFFVLPTLSISHLLTRPDLKKYAWEDLKSLRDKIKEI